MERICPLLALAGDDRSVSAVPDPRHRCHALDPPAPLELLEQATRCLTEAHLRCELLLGYRGAHARPSTVPAPAPDATFVSTRLVIDAGLRASQRPRLRPRVRRTAAFLAAGAAVAAVGASVTGGLSSLRLPLLDPLSTALPLPAQTPLADVPSPTPTASPSPSVTDAPDRIAPSPTPSLVESPTDPSPSIDGPRTYLVQAGDTLYEIAVEFGSTVEAIMAANGLSDPNVISVGQTLIIP